MLTRDAVAYFGSVSRLARLLGVSRVAIYLWRERVPPLRQFQIECLTRDLKAESRYKPRSSDEWVDKRKSARARFMSRTRGDQFPRKQSERMKT